MNQSLHLFKKILSVLPDLLKKIPAGQMIFSIAAWAPIEREMA
jgi:hypothetical protein